MVSHHPFLLPLLPALLLSVSMLHDAIIPLFFHCSLDTHLLDTELELALVPVAVEPLLPMHLQRNWLSTTMCGMPSM